MAVRKINSGVQPDYRQNDIMELSKLFPKEFAYFFMPFDAPQNAEAEALYVSDEDMEGRVNEALYEGKSGFSVLMGKKGTGKSTLLRHCIGALQNQVWIKKKTLFSVSSFDFGLSAALFPFQIGPRILSMNAKLEEAFPKLSEYFYSAQGKDQFYKFVEKMSIDILQYPSKDDSESLTPDQRQTESLEYAHKNFPAVYESLKLQFFLSSSFCPIQRLVLCIDGIDELELCQIEEILCPFVALYKQMTSSLQDKMSKYYMVKLIVSIEPDSFCGLSAVRERQSWPVSQVIVKSNRLNYEKYFSRRLRCYSQRQEVENLEAWKKCQQQFGLICQKFGGKYDSMIKNLAFHDVGESLKLYAKVLCNQTWVRQGKRDSDNDWFNPETYVLNNISVIRAIACGENEIFVNTPESYVSNILYNTPDKDYSILCLYILALFERHSGTAESYGSQYLILDNVVSSFQDFFPTMPDIAADVQEVLRYLYRHKILQRSFKDTFGLENSSHWDVLSNHSRLYLSSKGKELWNMLQSDSVLMEMCREDYYREYNSDGCCNNEYGSFVLMDQQQDELFIDLCRIEAALIDLEEKYISDARENRTICLVTEALGNQMMCSYLLQGIKNSMEYSGRIRQTNVYDAYAAVSERIYTL